MKQFAEMIRVIDQFREPSLDVIDYTFRSSKDEMGARLYQGIRAGTYESDFQAAKEMYGTTPTDPRYATLKHRLKSRLLNSLCHLNLKKAGFAEYSQAVYQANRRLFLSQTLVSLGARTLGIKLAENTLALAQKFDFTHIEFETAFILREHYAYSGKNAKYELNNKLLRNAMECLLAELKSWEYFDQLQLRQAQSTNIDATFGAAFQQHAKELEVLYKLHPTYTIALNYFRVNNFALTTTLDFKGIISTCDEAISYLNERPHLSSKGRLAEFAMKKLECHLLLRDYNGGRKTVEECEKLLAVGSNNWFGSKEYHFLLLMHTDHFIDAEKLFHDVTTHPRFEDRPDWLKERWKIFELYLIYALRSLPDFEKLPSKKNFDLKAFLRFVPTASKDKHGMQIAVLIVHILYLIDSKDFSGIIDRMEALKTYRSRYLRTSANRRSSLFFKLLTVMENNSFSYKRTLKKAEPLLKQLKETTEEAETDEELQVIPYEWLWDRVMVKLQEYEEGYRGS